MKKINIGLIGFGNVGSGVVKILKERKKYLSEKAGVELNIVKICDKDLTSKRSVKVEKGLLTTDPYELINDPKIEILVELIGGINPAKEYILKAIEKGKHIVTANKALLAEEGKEIFAFAQDKSKNIYFEASVGAGIPIIKSLRQGLIANKFSSIFGIVNGTSNYVLSEMTDKKRPFIEVLKEAKDRGFAEKDPSLDIQGVDSAHKLVLLVYLCFGKLIDFKDVYIEGIQDISLLDVNYAEELGFTIKLLAIAKKVEEELEVRVHPTLIPQPHLLSSVKGVFNAIYVNSDLAGSLLFYGPGAGRFSATSAVIADLIDLANDLQAGLFRSTLNIVEDETIKKIRRIDDIESKYYIRFMAVDKPGVLAKISGVLAKFGISIASVTQKERKKAKVVPIVMIIHEAKERAIREALKIISKFEIIKEKPVAIRMEEL